MSLNIFVSQGILLYRPRGKNVYPLSAPLTCPPASRRQPLRSAFSLPLLSLLQHPFFLFFFFFFSQYKSGMRKAVLFSSEVTGRLSPSSKTGFSSVVFLLYHPYLLSFQRFSTRSRGSCTRFLFPDFLLIFSLASEERAEKEPIKEKRITLLRVVGKTKYSLNPRVITATKKDQGQAR